MFILDVSKTKMLKNGKGVGYMQCCGTAIQMSLSSWSFLCLSIQHQHDKSVQLLTTHFLTLSVQAQILEQTSCIVCFLKIFGRLQGSRLILSKRSEAVFYHHINHKHTAY